MALGAIQTRHAAARKEMTAAFEERERLLVAGATHRERSVRIRLADEIEGVRPALLRLSWVSAVTSVALDARLAVRARQMKLDGLAGFTYLFAVASEATALACFAA